jgi:signal transduction histidine kinase
MSIKSHLEKLGIPSLSGQPELFYQIGTAAITLAILALLGWFSVVLGRQFHFSFAWILDIILLVTYILRKTNILLLIATAFVLVILTLVGLLIGSPFSSIFGLIIFLILIIGGWFLQNNACSSEESKLSFEQTLKAIVFSPLSYTAYLLDRLKFIDTSKD